MVALTPAGLARFGVPALLPTGLMDSRIQAFQPYRLQPPHAVPLSRSLGRTGFPKVRELGFAIH